MFRIYKDEHYPVYTLVQDDGDGGWIPNVTLPDDAITSADWEQWHLVKEAYKEWQDRLGEIYKGLAPPGW